MLVRILIWDFASNIFFFNKIRDDVIILMVCGVWCA